jgi:DNA polymerase V
MSLKSLLSLKEERDEGRKLGKKESRGDNIMPKGGQRFGAGRPKGSGKFGQDTKAVRVPISDIDTIFRYVRNEFYHLPFYQHAISAGFLSPTEDDMEDKLDLNELLIKHPSATFFLKVSGSSMINAGIHNNDILIVDRSIEPTHGRIVIAAVNGELTVKKLSIKNQKTQLVAENNTYAPIDITEEMDLVIWGVVTNVIHSL